MKGDVVTLFCLALACAVVVEASVLKETKRISPTLKPESPKEFDKDYPGDKRPKVDVLHFRHPYPVVQDSEDFDKDFVKDENTDNGEYFAQSEYDRLRHKVAKLKQQAAEAMEKKIREKAELERAMKERDEVIAKDEAEIEKKSKEMKKPLEPVKPEKPVKPVKKVEPQEKKLTWSWSDYLPWGSKVEPKKEEPEAKKTTRNLKATPALDETAVATEAVERSIANLKECQEDLAKAKAELKKLMEELEEAKTKQAEAAEKLKQATIKQKEARKYADDSHSKFMKEDLEHAAAVDAYLKQKAIVDKLSSQLKDAGEKVKALRDAEDKDGGVYPTSTKTTKKSGAFSMSASLPLIVGVLAIWHTV